jgi:hypothetical protein
MKQSESMGFDRGSYIVSYRTDDADYLPPAGGGFG